jgi:tape measure domain-containing protein
VESIGKARLVIGGDTSELEAALEKIEQVGRALGRQIGEEIAAGLSTAKTQAGRAGAEGAAAAAAGIKSNSDLKNAFSGMSQGARAAFEGVRKEASTTAASVVRMFSGSNSAAIALAKNLNTTFSGAKGFAKDLGLSAQAASSAIDRLKQLEAVGATTADKYRVLRDEFGLTAIQMGAISKASKGVEAALAAQAKAAESAAERMAAAQAQAAAAQATRQQNSSGNVVQLAANTGTSYGGAQKMAADLGLTAQAAAIAVVRIQQLNAVGATTEQQFDALSDELGLTRTQFDALSKQADRTGKTIVQAFAAAIKGTGSLKDALKLSVSSAMSGMKGALQSGMQGIFQGFGQSLFGTISSVILAPFKMLQSEIGNLISVGSMAESAEIAFATMLGSAEAGKAALEDLIDFAASTPFELPEVRSSGQMLLAFGIEAENMIETLRVLGDVSAGVSQPMGEIAEIYGKAKVQGRLFSDDIARLTGRGIPVTEELAKQFGVGTDKVKELVQAGKIGFPQIEKAFASMAGESGQFNNLMAKQAQTIGGKLSNLADNFTKIRIEAYDALQPAFTAGLDFIAELVSSVQGVNIFKPLAAQAKKFSDLLEKNPQYVKALSAQLKSGISTVLENIANLAEQLLNYLIENPDAISDMIDRIGELGKALGTILKMAADLTIAFANAANAVSGIGDNAIAKAALSMTGVGQGAGMIGALTSGYQTVRGWFGGNQQSAATPVGAIDPTQTDGSDKEGLNKAPVQARAGATKAAAAQVTAVDEALAEKLRDISTNISEFYNTLKRNAEELALTIKQTDLNNSLLKAKTELTKALSGFGESFFDDFVGRLSGLIDKLFEPLENFLTAQEKLLSVNTQLQDSLNRGAGLAAGLNGAMLPSGAPGAPGSSGGFYSPLQGRSVQDLVNYQESAGQSFRATRNRRSGRGLHNGIDFDSRVGGGRGAQVVAMEGGTASIRAIGTNQAGEQSMQVKIQFTDENGRPIEYQYNHLSEAAVQQALGQTSGTTQVRAGQLIGTVGATDNLSSGAHLDVKIKVGDNYVDPQQYMAARSGSGGYAETADRRRINIGAASRDASPASVPTGSSPAPAARPTDTPAPAASRGRYVPRGGTLSRAERVQSDPDGAAAITATANRLGLPVDQFAALMSWESGGSFNPNVMGGDNNQYQGLIQFSRDNQNTYGIRQGQTISEQMPAIERYLQDRGFQPGQHDIRHAYSAVLAGNADERYWNRRDSNGTSVRNAAPKFQQGDHYERAQQFLRDSGVPVGSVTQGGAAPVMTGSSVDTGAAQLQLNSAMDLSTQNAAQMAGSVRSELEAQNLLSSAEFDALISDQQRALNRGVESAQDSARGIARSQEDIRLELLGNSPYAEYVRQTTQQNRAFEDANRDTLKAVERGENSIGVLTRSREVLQTQIQRARDMGVDSGSIARLESLLPNIDEAIAATQTELDRMRSQLDEAEDLFKQRNEMLEREYKAEMDARRAASRQRTENLQLTMRAAELSDAGNDVGAGFISQQIRERDLNQNYEESMRPLREELEVVNAEIEKMREAGLAVDSTAVTVATERAAYLEEMLDGLGTQRSIEIELNYREMDNNFRSMQERLSSERDEAAANLLESQGDVFGAASIRERSATTAENQRFSEQIAQINSFAASGRYAPEDIMRMRTEAEQLNSINLQSIDGQFKDLGETIGGIAQGSLNNFFTSILNGSKSAGEAFKDLIGSMLSQLAQLAINSAFADIFGGGLGGGAAGGSKGSGISGILGAVMGGLGGGGGGKDFGGTVASVAAGGGGGKGWGSLIGTVASAFLGGMKDGGSVADTSSAFSEARKSRGAIGDALRREGPNSILSALTPGEEVLDTTEAGIYRRMFPRGIQDTLASGFNGRVANFKLGGTVGGGGKMALAPSIAGGGGGVSISAPINMTLADRGKGDVDPAEFQRAVDARFHQLVQQESRPNGSLNKLGRR